VTSDLGARNRASRDRLAAVIARLGGRSVELPGGWTAAAVLAHLAFWDAFVAARLEKFARDRGPMEPGSVFVIFVFVIAAAEVAVGLAIVLSAYRNRPVVDVDEIRAMKRPRLLDRSLHRKEHLDEIERALR